MRTYRKNHLIKKPRYIEGKQIIYIVIVSYNSKMVRTYSYTYMVFMDLCGMEVEYVRINYSRGNIVIMVRAERRW